MTPPPSHTVCFTGGGVISYFALFLGAISHLILPTHPLTFNGMVPYLFEQFSYSVAHSAHHVRCGIFRCMHCNVPLKKDLEYPKKISSLIFSFKLVCNNLLVELFLPILTKVPMIAPLLCLSSLKQSARVPL